MRIITVGARVMSVRCLIILAQALPIYVLLTTTTTTTTTTPIPTTTAGKFARSQLSVYT
jgi:hypothetical protein